MAGTPGLVIAEIDGTQNDIEGTKISGFPTLLLFQAGAKDHPIDYWTNDRTVEAFKEWLAHNSQAYKSHIEKRDL